MFSAAVGAIGAGKFVHAREERIGGVPATATINGAACGQREALEPALFLAVRGDRLLGTDLTRASRHHTFIGLLGLAGA